MNINAQEQKFYYEKNQYLTYKKYGEGSMSIVFLHGFGASKNSWDELYPLFDTQKYTSYLIDFKGFGNSTIPKDDKYSLKDNAMIILKFINSNIISNYILVGHSYGGGVSLILLSTKQLKTEPKALILLDCAAYNTQTPFFINYLNTPFFNKMMYLFTTPQMRASFSLKRIVSPENYSKKMLNRYIESYSGKEKDYSFITTAKHIDPDNYKELISSYEKIKIPTLIIWGKQDNVLSLEQGVMLSKQIKSSKLEIIDNCGHIPNEEKPLETYKKIISFIQNL